MGRSISNHELSAFGGSAGSVLKAGGAAVDITPPLDVGLLMSSVQERWAPFQSVRSPLKARVLALERGEQRIVLVSLDLIGLNTLAVNGWNQFKCSISRGVAQAVHPDRIVITCTHTHSAPESLALTDLYQGQQFRLWLGQLGAKLAQTISEAIASARPCTLAIASSELKGFSLQRRVPTASGIVMSDHLQPIAPELFNRGPIDHRVRGLLLRALDGSSIATLVHANCHPVHEMCIPHISADFPGELCAALEEFSSNGLPIYFNGAAGDINPPTVSCGIESARQHGQALAKAITLAGQRATVIGTEPMVFRNQTIQLPIRSTRGVPVQETHPGRLSALRLGLLAMVFLPGEIFVETALAIENSSPFAQTLVVGYAEDSIGYVPTQRAFDEGGYEIGPGKWSFLQRGAEPIIRSKAAELLRELWNVELKESEGAKSKSQHALQ